jgi:hypothetical protein
MKLVLENNELVVAAMALAVHLSAGTESDATEDFLGAAEICGMIASYRTNINQDIVQLELTDSQCIVLNTSLEYAFSFYCIYAANDLPAVRSVLVKLGEYSDVELFDGIVPNCEES